MADWRILNAIGEIGEDQHRSFQAVLLSGVLLVVIHFSLRLQMWVPRLLTELDEKQKGFKDVYDKITAIQVECCETPVPSRHHCSNNCNNDLVIPVPSYGLAVSH